MGNSLYAIFIGRNEKSDNIFGNHEESHQQKILQNPEKTEVHIDMTSTSKTKNEHGPYYIGENNGHPVYSASHFC